jgi:hypothetical protein
MFVVFLSYLANLELVNFGAELRGELVGHDLVVLVVVERPPPKPTRPLSRPPTLLSCLLGQVYGTLGAALLNLKRKHAG